MSLKYFKGKENTAMKISDLAYWNPTTSLNAYFGVRIFKLEYITFTFSCALMTNMRKYIEAIQIGRAHV